MKTLIQIGCNVGNDEVYELLKNTNNKFRAILIDPNINSLNRCKTAYHDILESHSIDFLDYAIVPEENINSVDLYVPKNDDCSPFVSTIQDHTIRHSHSECDKITTKAMSINALFEKLNVIDLDYLYIDTEGLCVDILINLDMNKYKIDKIIFEYIHSDGLLSYGGPKLNTLYEKMNKYNYIGKKIGYNIVCKKNDK